MLSPFQGKAQNPTPADVNRGTRIVAGKLGVDTNSATSGMFLKWNGSIVTWGTPSSFTGTNAFFLATGVGGRGFVSEGTAGTVVTNTFGKNGVITLNIHNTTNLALNAALDMDAYAIEGVRYGSVGVRNAQGLVGAGLYLSGGDVSGTTLGVGNGQVQLSRDGGGWAITMGGGNATTLMALYNDSIRAATICTTNFSAATIFSSTNFAPFPTTTSTLPLINVKQTAGTTRSYVMVSVYLSATVTEVAKAELWEISGGVTNILGIAQKGVGVVASDIYTLSAPIQPNSSWWTTNTSVGAASAAITNLIIRTQ